MILDVEGRKEDPYLKRKSENYTNHNAKLLNTFVRVTLYSSTH